MIIQFDETGYGGKRMVTFAAESDEEDALVLAVRQAFHKGEIRLQTQDENGLTIAWVHKK